MVERSLTQSIAMLRRKILPNILGSIHDGNPYWHCSNRQIEFEFPLISDRSFFWRVEKQCSHPYAAWRCLWMVCSRWMRPRMSFLATGVLISSSSLYVYYVLYIVHYNTIRYNNIFIYIHVSMPNLLTNIIQGGLVPSRFGLSRWASVDAAQFGLSNFIVRLR